MPHAKSQCGTHGAKLRVLLGHSAGLLPGGTIFSTTLRAADGGCGSLRGASRSFVHIVCDREPYGPS